MPFASPYKRDIHFSRHGAKFGAATAEQYEQMADEFLFGMMDHDTREGFRINDRLRFKDSNRHFGVAAIAAPEHIRTFYPVPAIKITNRGGCAAFFTYECGREDL